jgi:hypothetical protein
VRLWSCQQLAQLEDYRRSCRSQVAISHAKG